MKIQFSAKQSIMFLRQRLFYRMDEAFKNFNADEASQC